MLPVLSHLLVANPAFEIWQDQNNYLFQMNATEKVSFSIGPTKETDCGI